MNSKKFFLECLNELKIELSEHSIQQFKKYYEQIIYWNNKINITALTHEKDIYLKHFIDSLSLIKVADLTNQSVADIGTGAGIPGLPLKLVNPGLKVTFIDSSKKKMMVLASILEELDISDCVVVDDNIENIGRQQNYRNSFDIVTSRALGQFNLVLEYGIPLLKLGGRLIQFKGPNVEKEVENSQKALDLLGAEIKKSIEFKLPFSDFHRSIIVVEKVSETESKYPRRAGMPKKRPL